MKKRRKTKNIYDEAITYDNIYAMWNIIRKTCKNKKALFYFSLNLSTNINYIYYLLKERKYRPSRYRTFIIFEPKPRLVMSQTITDKIVNHFIANYYLIPYLESKLIDSNVATRKNMGSSYADKLLKKYIRKIIINEKSKEIYCLKIDIKKYFYSIDHNLLINEVKRYISDEEVINLLKLVIKETNEDYVNQAIKYYNEHFKINIPYYINNKGLSIGAMSSQFLAIFYLNSLDHYIKEELKCNYYVRYMDDFIILSTDKERLKEIWIKIKKKLKELKLEENKKSNIYLLSKGVNFLGYRYKVINSKLIINCSKKTYYKIRRKLKKLYSKDKVLFNKTYASYYGYLKDIYDLRDVNFKMKIIDKYKSYKDKYKKMIVIVKDGIFYKTFYDDAKIMWYFI